MIENSGPVSARIVTIGKSLPERVLTNAELQESLDTSDEWIVAKTGIRTRRIAAPEDLASDLGARAVLDACQRADISPAEIDLFIVGTWTADYLNPATSAVLLNKLNVTASAFDVHSGGCAGGVVALDVGARYAASVQGSTVAVVLTEVNSKMLNWKDRSTAVFLGDGAACYILRGGEPGPLRTTIRVLPEGLRLAWVPGGGRAGTIPGAPADPYFAMDGTQIWKTIHEEVPKVVAGLLGTEFSPDMIDLVVTHQANLRLVESLVQKCGFTLSQTVTTVEELGNTAGASVPLTLRHAEDTGRLKRGDLVLAVAFGAGMTIGATLLRW